jgi:hypothetical protein
MENLRLDLLGELLTFTTCSAWLGSDSSPPQFQCAAHRADNESSPSLVPFVALEKNLRTF